MAIDFETADYGADSACAIGLVRVEGGKIARKAHFLIRPPRERVMFTSIHGIRWSDVADQPGFGELWPQLAGFFSEVDFIAAHNAPFDRRVLMACCQGNAIRPPVSPFLCTVRVARRAWALRSARLPDVCEHLGIPLKHHEALSDAEACARIVLAANPEHIAII